MKVERSCQNCGGSFALSEARIAEGRGRFCSSACARAGRKEAGRASWRRRWTASRAEAKRRGLEWTVSEVEYQCFLSTECVYCGGGSDSGIGLDRIDNTKGYVAGNVAACCPRCNSVRNDYFSFEEMLLIGRTIRQIVLDRRRKELAHGRHHTIVSGA